MENTATPFTSKGHSYLASTRSGLLQPQGWPPTPPLLQSHRPGFLQYLGTAVLVRPTGLCAFVSPLSGRTRP